MNLDNEKRLKQFQLRYPRVWGTSQLEWGLEYGMGWDDLIDTMSASINAILNEEMRGEFQVLQAKEKFGRLRFYYRLEGLDGNPGSAIAEAVKISQEASQHICDRCGRPGKLLREKAVKTRCAACAQI